MGSRFGSAALRRRGVAVAMLLGVWALGDGVVSGAGAQPVPAVPPAKALPAMEPASVEPMTDAQAVGVGCVVVAAGVGFATLAAGGVALAATGVGVASTAVAVPVVVATMAGGCTLGATAAPAFLWAKSHGHTLAGAVSALWPGASR